jgi:hydroxymethylbilane synthase
LLAIREDIEVVAMRGNVDTRLRKLAEREVDALVLALAGLRRLAASGETRASTALAGGTGPLAATPLPLDRFIPAAGQGCLALEGRTDDETALAAAASITDPSSLVSLRAERALTAALEATCHTPVGAFATSQDDYLSLTAFVGLPDGSAWLRDTLVGDAADPETLGRAVAERLLKAGAGDLLAQAHAMMKP